MAQRRLFSQVYESGDHGAPPLQRRRVAPRTPETAGASAVLRVAQCQLQASLRALRKQVLDLVEGVEPFVEQDRLLDRSQLALAEQPEVWRSQETDQGEHLLGQVLARARRSHAAGLQEGTLCRLLESWAATESSQGRAERLQAPAEGQSPLCCLPESWHRALLLLVQWGADPRALTPQGRSWLQHASESAACEPLLPALVSALEGSLSRDEAQGLLVGCIKQGCQESVERLLRAGASLQLPVESPCAVELALDHGRNALAVWLTSEALRAQFPEQAYDVVERVRQGGTHPFWVSFPRRNPVVEQVVRQLAPTFNLTDPRGYTVLHYVAEYGPQWIPLFIELGADPHRPDREGKTAVIEALLMGLPDEVILALCPAHQIWRSQGIGSALDAAICMGRISLLQHWESGIRTTLQQGRTFLQALEERLPTALSLVPVEGPLGSSLLSILPILGAGDLWTAAAALQRLELEVPRLPQAARQSLQRLALKVFGRTRMMEHLLCFAPSLAPGCPLHETDLPVLWSPPEYDLQLAQTAEQVFASIEGALFRRAHTEQQLLEQLNRMVLLLNRRFSVDLSADFASFQRGGITRLMRNGLGFATGPSWAMVVLPWLQKKFTQIEQWLEQAEATQPLEPGVECLEAFLAADADWRWQLERLTLMCGPCAPASQASCRVHWRRRLALEALDRALQRLFKGDDEDDFLDAVPFTHRSAFIDLVGPSLGLIDRPLIWAGRSAIEVSLPGQPPQLLWAGHAFRADQQGFLVSFLADIHRELLEAASSRLPLVLMAQEATPSMQRELIAFALQQQGRSPPDARAQATQVQQVWEQGRAVWQQFRQWLRAIERQGLALGEVVRWIVSQEAAHRAPSATSALNEALHRPVEPHELIGQGLTWIRLALPWFPGHSAETLLQRLEQTILDHRSPECWEALLAGQVGLHLRAHWDLQQDPEACYSIHLLEQVLRAADVRAWLVAHGLLLQAPTGKTMASGS